ncbi:MAG: DMT family transporter [Planctomycetota bacterium]
MRIGPRSLGYLLAFASAATGAIRFNLAVYAKGEGFSLVPFLAGTLLVGTICSTAHVAVRDGLGGLSPLRQKTGSALLYGCLMAWSTLSHFLALYYLNETVMSSISQTSILFVIALAVCFLGERFTRREWFGLVTICAGLFLFRPWTGEGLRLKGFLLLMSGVVSGALATVGAKRWVEGVLPRVLMLWRNVVALLVVGALASAYEAPRLTAATGVACAVTGILGPYLHGLFFLQALERVDAAKAALVSRVQPAIVFLVSWAFLARLPDRDEILSAALLLAGALWLVAARRQPAAPPTEPD